MEGSALLRVCMALVRSMVRRFGEQRAQNGSAAPEAPAAPALPARVRRRFARRPSPFLRVRSSEGSYARTGSSSAPRHAENACERRC